MSVITLIFRVVVLAVSIAFPLRQLSNKLDKKLTPDDIAVQLEGFRIRERLSNHGALVAYTRQTMVTLTRQVSVLFKDKEQFASKVAHELKNPIASIIAYAENYEEQNPDDAQTVSQLKPKLLEDEQTCYRDLRSGDC